MSNTTTAGAFSFNSTAISELDSDIDSGIVAAITQPVSDSNTIRLKSARYGKDKVRVFRVVRSPDNGDGKRWHEVVEYNVCLLVEGEIDTSFTQADNSVVVATDSMKNIIYYLAKLSPHILQPELFALHVGVHILRRYAHLKKASVEVEKLRWKRIVVGENDEGKGEGHSHAFLRDGDDKRVVNVKISKVEGENSLVAKITAGIKDLLVIKTTGSAFENFIRDEYTTLVEVNDRIFSTAVDLEYWFPPISIPGADINTFQKDGVELKGGIWDEGKEFESIAESARKTTLNVFALDESASVQATLYKMAEKILIDNKRLQEVQYELPNKHYIPVDMRYIGVDNLTPASADVFCPVSHPSGVIKARLSRV